MAGDFDKLFGGDDWRPQDFEPDSGPRFGGGEPDDASLRLPFPSLPDDDTVPAFTTETENTRPRSLNEKEVKVMGVYMHQDPKMPAQHFVLLRDNRGRRVPIWVGQFEAWAISTALENDAPERPMTHDLFKLLLEKMDATVERVIIDDLWNETFYAKVGVVRADGETLELDARPSDAIALAVRFHAPIYMAENVMDATDRTE